MNEKFYALPEKRRRAILNAGFRVFAQNPYRKSPMSEIAAEAGISKSLLFHYFRNKRELYLFLWETCARMTMDVLQKERCFEAPGLFEIMRRGLRAKAGLMRQYPALGAFALRAYYERDPEVYEDIQASIRHYGSYQSMVQRLKLDPALFKPGLDLELMYQDMYWASEGYVRGQLGMGDRDVDVDRMERDFGRMIDFWKKLYLRKEESYAGHTNE